MNSFSLLILMDLCGHLTNAVTDMKRSGMEVRLVASDVFLGSLFVFNRVEIHLLKIPSGTILVLFESILVPEIYKNPSKTYCFRGIQLNIKKKEMILRLPYTQLSRRQEVISYLYYIP